MTPNHALAATRPVVLLSPARARRATMACAITAAVGGLFIAASPADAGVTLLSRQSTLHAVGDTGVPGAGFDVADSTTGFDRFANRIGTEVPADGLVSFAHQYSVPGILGESGAGLEGAFAEGEVRSGVAGSAGSALSASGMEMLFQVDTTDSAYSLGASIGASGNGAVKVELCPVVGGTLELPVYAIGIDNGEAGIDGLGKSLEQKGLLSPGQYMLRVDADASDLPGEASDADAYFTFSFQLSKAPGSSGSGGGNGNQPPVAVPLPPAFLGGGGLLGLIALRRLRRQRSRQTAHNSSTY